jgi:hypothetical protein
MDDKNYQADIEERITTVRVTEGDDPIKFLKDFSTLLLKAQTANFRLTGEQKATYFLRVLPSTYDTLKAEWNQYKGSRRSPNYQHPPLRNSGGCSTPTLLTYIGRMK